jgi:predicted DNA-binding transcriptional regulator YafY
MNRTDRLMAIVLHLQGRRVVRAEELAERFAVSLRTIYRDMAALGEGGVPIAGEAGVGYTLVKGYHLPPVMLTADEASALFLGVQLVREFTDDSLSEPSTSALDKLRAVLPPEQRDHVERVGRATVVAKWSRRGDAATDGTGAAPPAALRGLQEAIARRRLVRLDYRGREQAETLRREVEPLGVLFYGGRWYLVAWCRLRDSLRHFRLDRIQGVETTGAVFAARADFSLEEHVSDYAKAGETFPARVWFADGEQARARAESYATLVEVEGSRRDGGAEFTMLTWSYDWLAGWLFSFGGGAEALHPPELRDALRRRAGEVLARHADRPKTPRGKPS